MWPFLSPCSAPGENHREKQATSLRILERAPWLPLNSRARTLCFGEGHGSHQGQSLAHPMRTFNLRFDIASALSPEPPCDPSEPLLFLSLLSSLNTEERKGSKERHQSWWCGGVWRRVFPGPQPSREHFVLFPSQLYTHVPAGQTAGV